MVTLYKYGNIVNENVSEIRGKSTDNKPVRKIENITVSNGSTFLEMDTKKIFMFDEDNSCWIEM